MATLTEKVALVTGASSGIGRGIAERLAWDGASVVVNYGKSANKAEAVVAGIKKKGGEAVAIQADISRVANIRQLFRQTLDQLGHLDIVIANAGMFGQKPFIDVTEEEFDRMFALNAKGTFFTLQEAARHLSNEGRLIFISSAATAMPFAEAGLYKGSEAAGEQFIETLAKELGPKHITVNTISPGFTETDMLPKDESFRTMGVKMSALGRLGQPSDIANVVAFLVSDEGGWVTGNTLQVGGGIV